MMQKNRYGTMGYRLRLSAREIAVAVALTVAAATFLVMALAGDNSNDGSPVAAVEPRPEKM